MPERARDETFEERRDAGVGERGVDVGQKEVQARKDVEDALGYIPSDGASLGLDEDLSPKELEEHQAEANKQFTMPPDGLAAEKPVPPHSAEAASSDASEASGEYSDAPAKSASREEWDAYAEAHGVNPSEFSNKDDLAAHFGR